MKTAPSILSLLLLLAAFILLNTSCRKEYRLPMPHTYKISSITHTTAQCKSMIVSDGGDDITERGVCWSTNKNPTISDNKTVDGKDTGTFISIITGLTANADYYVRAYATNREGTGYGNNLKFTTQLTVEDIDGNSYKIITIGEQVWMKENLKVTRYKNGDSLFSVWSDTEWSQSGGIGAYTPVNYGYCYNGHAAVIDPRGICPEGWHVSTDDEWKEMELYLGMSPDEVDLYAVARGTNQGDQIKSDSNVWYMGGKGTNSSDFSGMPGGSRNDFNGIFGGHGEQGSWWSSTAFYVSKDNFSFWGRKVSYDNQKVYRHTYMIGAGLCVRCIRDN